MDDMPIICLVHPLHLSLSIPVTLALPPLSFRHRIEEEVRAREVTVGKRGKRLIVTGYSWQVVDAYKKIGFKEKENSV